MREGDLNLHTTSLQHALKTVNIHWDLVQDQWKDQVAERFGNEVIEPIGPKVNAALKALNRLSAVLARAREEIA